MQGWYNRPINDQISQLTYPFQYRVYYTNVETQANELVHIPDFTNFLHQLPW
jgi:hypothetical protein